MFADERYKLKNIVGLANTPTLTTEDIYTVKLRLALDSDNYGEVRTAEDAYWMMQTITRQCKGSITTMHYQDPYECIEGIAMLICTKIGFNDFKMIRYQVAKMINILLETHNDKATGKYYINAVYEVEITDRNNMEFRVNTLFKYNTETKHLDMAANGLSKYTIDQLQHYDFNDSRLAEMEKLFKDKKV